MGITVGYLPQVIPDTPVPLFVTAVIVPVTCVPWDCRPGFGLSVGSSSSSIRSYPGRNTPCRSGWSGLVPESIMATTTVGEPLAIVHASSICTMG